MPSKRQVNDPSSVVYNVDIPVCLFQNAFDVWQIRSVLYCRQAVSPHNSIYLFLRLLALLGVEHHCEYKRAQSGGGLDEVT